MPERIVGLPAALVVVVLVIVASVLRGGIVSKLAWSLVTLIAACVAYNEWEGR